MISMTKAAKLISFATQFLLNPKRVAYKKKVHKKRLFRRIVTKNFSSRKVALGERNSYIQPLFPLDWIRIDWAEADYNINLNRNPTLPFKNSSQNVIYTAHMIEHLSEESVPKLLDECYRILKPGGYIRIEAPDAEKLVDLYLANDEMMLRHFRKFRQDILINKFGYPNCFEEDHLSVLGEISNYIVPGQWVHIPVYAPKDEFDRKLKQLDLDVFFDWCISLQTPEQRDSGGHQSAIYFSKLERMLNSSGFSKIEKVDFGITKIPTIKLNTGFGSIKEKSHRSFYSIYVEASKLC